MADRFEMFPQRSVGSSEIWSWRVGVWATSVVSSILTFHTIIRFPWTLDFFAVLASFWLQKEIAYYRMAQTRPLFEGPGEASYSLYLTHVHGANLVQESVKFSPQVMWWLASAATAVGCVLFYWGIERPSHRLARKWAGALSSRQMLRAKPIAEARCDPRDDP